MASSRLGGGALCGVGEDFLFRVGESAAGEACRRWLVCPPLRGAVGGATVGCVAFILPLGMVVALTIGGASKSREEDKRGRRRMDGRVCASIP